MSVFEYLDYKKFILDYVFSLPNKGRGELLSISNFIGVNSSFLSQALRGHKNLSCEQCLKIAHYFSLSELETDFFLILLSLNKAGTQELRDYYEIKRRALLKKSKHVSKRVQGKKIISDHDRAVFYSNWVFSAIKLACDIEGVDIKTLASALKLSENLVRKSVSFLLSSGLIEKSENGFSVGKTHTHIPADSPLVVSHHKNWRIKAMERHIGLSEAELAFSAPMSISRDDFDAVKLELLKLIEKVSKRVSKSKSEEVACLNLDLFYISQFQC